MDGYVVEWMDRLGIERRREFRPESLASLAAAQEFQRNLAKERKVLLEEADAFIERARKAGRTLEPGEIPTVPGPPYLGVLPKTTRKAG